MQITKAFDYKHFFDLSTELLLSVDFDGKITNVNFAFAENLGYSKEFLINKNVSDLLSPEDLQATKEEMKKMLSEELVSPNFTNHYLHKDGTYRKLKWLAKLIPSQRMLYGIAEDITDANDTIEQKQTLAIIKRTQVLENTLSRHKKLYDNAPDLLCTVDHNTGFIIELNQTLAKKLGYSKEELIDKNIKKLYHPDSWIKVSSNLESYFQNFNPDQKDLQLLRKDGTIIDVNLKISVVKNSNGEVLYHGVVFRDITERKKLERSLNQSQLLFRTLTDKSPVGITLASLDRKLLYVNSTFAKMIGYSVKELMGKDWAEFTYPEDQSENIRKYESLLNDEKKTIRLDKRYYHKNGDIIWCSLTIVKVWNEIEGRALIMTTINDISEQKKLNLILKKQEEQFRTLATLSPVGIFQNDISGSCTYVNEAVSRLVGMPIEECLGNGWATHIHKEDKDRTYAAWLDTVKNGVLFRQDYRFLLPDGTLNWVLGEAKPIKNKKGEKVGFIGTLTDITEQKKVELELELQQFIYSVSHDLRAPIRHIEGFTSWIIEEELESMSPNGKDLIRKVVTSAKRLGVMVDDLLEYSRNRNLVLQKSFIDLSKVVDYVLGEMSIDIKKIEFKISALPVVFADKKLILSVFENLISNAIKYTSGRAKPVIEIWAEEFPAFFTIFIKDNGIGFNMDYHNKLFVIFQRLHQNSKEFKGNGIGLANVKRIIQSHGGTIDGKGEVDNGATFHFTLPKLN